MSISVRKRWASLNQFGRNTNDSLLWEPDLSSLWVWRSIILIFYLTSFHSPASPYPLQAVWNSPWHGNQVHKGRRPVLAMPGLVELLEMGFSAWVLLKSIHRPWEGSQWCHLNPCERWAVVPADVTDLLQKVLSQILWTVLRVKSN